MTWLFGLSAGHPSRYKRLDDGTSTPHPGAVVSGMVEAVETMGWCNYVHRHVAHSCEPFKTHMIRTPEDEVVGLQERAIRAEEAGCDFVLSVHINWWHTEVLSGASAYYAPGDLIGQSVSDTILRCMPAPLHRPKRHGTAANPTPQDKWLEAPEAVLKPYADRGIPACLLEVGFMTNRVDYEAMRSPAVQFGVLSAICSGFARARVLLPRATHAPWAGG